MFARYLSRPQKSDPSAIAARRVAIHALSTARAVITHTNITSRYQSKPPQSKSTLQTGTGTGTGTSLPMSPAHWRPRSALCSPPTTLSIEITSIQINSADPYLPSHEPRALAPPFGTLLAPPAPLPSGSAPLPLPSRALATVGATHLQKRRPRRRAHVGVDEPLLDALEPVEIAHRAIPLAVRWGAVRRRGECQVLRARAGKEQGGEEQKRGREVRSREEGR